MSMNSRYFSVAVLTLSALAVHANMANAQSIFTNPITDSNPSSANPFTAGQTVDVNMTVSGIGRGSGVNANAGSNRYNANNWNSSSLNENDYFTWTLTPNMDYEIDFVSLTYSGQASGTGPSQFALRSSLSNFSTNIGNPSASGATIDLSGSEYQNLTEATTFRLYGWGGSSAAGTFSVNDFTFNGMVVSAPVPEPTGLLLLPAILLGLVSAMFTRKSLFPGIS